MTFNSSSRKLQANTNMYIAKQDLSEVYGNYIYLGIYDSEHNYTEVSKMTRDEILKKIELENEAR